MPPAVAEARAAFRADGLVEFLMLVGFYQMTAAFLKSLDVELEDGPPLGAQFRRRPGQACAPSRICICQTRIALNPGEDP